MYHEWNLWGNILSESVDVVVQPPTVTKTSTEYDNTEPKKKHSTIHAFRKVEGINDYVNGFCPVPRLASKWKCVYVCLVCSPTPFSSCSLFSFLVEISKTITWKIYVQPLDGNVSDCSGKHHRRRLYVAIHFLSPFYSCSRCFLPF